jgi:hypothetical protein
VSIWTPQRHKEPVPVSLAKKPGWSDFKENHRHEDAVVWYHTDGGCVFPLVFTRDTAGAWWDGLEGDAGVSELWDLTNGELEDGLRMLLGKIVEFIEQDVYPGNEACKGTVAELLERIEKIRVELTT